MAKLNVRDYLKDIHKHRDIYVIASGASMDYVDPSFFEGKITIDKCYYQSYNTG